MTIVSRWKFDPDVVMEILKDNGVTIEDLPEGTPPPDAIEIQDEHGNKIELPKDFNLFSDVKDDKIWLGTIEYRGFKASIYYSKVDDCIFGEVLNTRHVVMFEVDKPENTRQIFKETIDEFIEMCANIQTDY